MSDESVSGEELEEVVIQEHGVGASLTYEEDLYHSTRRFMKYFIIIATCFVVFCGLGGGAWSLYVGLCHITPIGQSYPFLNCSASDGNQPK